MMEYKHYYTITCGRESYLVEADLWVAIDLVWASQKYLFLPGSVVTITDDKNGNSKTFERE